MRTTLESSVLARVWRRAADDSFVVRKFAGMGSSGSAATNAFARAARDRRSRQRLSLSAMAESSMIVNAAMTVVRSPLRAWPDSRAHAVAQRLTALGRAIDGRRRLQWIGLPLVVAMSVHALLLVTSAEIVTRLTWLFVASVAAIGAVLVAAGRPFDTRIVPLGVGLGLVAGLAYTLSPIGVIFMAVMALLVWRASSVMEGLERRRFVTLMTTAIMLRVMVVAAIPLLVDPERELFTSLFGDAVYALQRSIWIRNVLLDVPVAPLQAFEAFHPVYGYTGYHYALAYLQLIFGPAPYGLHLFTAALFLIGAVLLHLQVRQSFGPDVARRTLAITVFLPTLFLWSVVPLKEAAQFFLTAVAIVGVVQGIRARTWPGRIGGAALAAAALFAVPPLRAGALVMSGGGIAAGLVLWVAGSRRWLAAALALAVVAGTFVALRNEAIVERARTVTAAAARRHIGHVFTRGSSYRALDARFYVTAQIDSLSDAEAVRFLGRSALAFVVEPTPWRPGSAFERLLLPQQLFWYVLLILACRGVVLGFRHDRLLTCLFIGVTIAGLVVIAPNSGNIGTLVRHRDMIVPFVVALGMLGATRMGTRASVNNEWH